LFVACFENACFVAACFVACTAMSNFVGSIDNAWYAACSTVACFYAACFLPSYLCVVSGLRRYTIMTAMTEAKVSLYTIMGAYSLSLDDRIRT